MRRGLIKPKFVPITEEKSVPIQQLVHIPSRKKYIRLEDVMRFIEDRFDKKKKGTKFADLEKGFGIRKARAQRILKRAAEKKHLFSYPARTNPQSYFPQSRHADVVMYFKNNRNVPRDTTSINTQFTSLESQKATSLLQVLQLSGPLPRYIHNLHLELSIDREFYSSIDVPIQKVNKAKKLGCRIDNNNVNLVFYRTGTVVVEIVCTKKPFKIENLEDEIRFTSYVGQVRCKIADLLSDSSGNIVPELTRWQLVECDINIDVPITDALLQSFPAIQIYPDLRRMQLQGFKMPLSLFTGTLRVYPKSLGEQGVMRLEELCTPALTLPAAIHNLFHPNAAMEKKLDNLTHLIEQNIGDKYFRRSHSFLPY